MNSDALIHLTKLIWVVGGAAFIFMALPHLLGTIVFLFEFISSLLTDSKPSASSTAKAKAAGVSLTSIAVLCSVMQILVLATPFILTQSGLMIKYYAEREEGYVKALSGRLNLAKQLTEADEQVKSLHQETYRCRQQIQHLSNECKALTQAVTLSRQTLSDQISQTSKINDKGDF